MSRHWVLSFQAILHLFNPTDDLQIPPAPKEPSFCHKQPFTTLHNFLLIICKHDESVGTSVGMKLGAGETVGETDGESVGTTDGARETVGETDGESVGTTDGKGETVGTKDGAGETLEVAVGPPQKYVVSSCPNSPPEAFNSSSM